MEKQGRNRIYFLINSKNLSGLRIFIFLNSFRSNRCLSYEIIYFVFPSIAVSINMLLDGSSLIISNLFFVSIISEIEIIFLITFSIFCFLSLRKFWNFDSLDKTSAISWSISSVRIGIIVFFSANLIILYTSFLEKRKNLKSLDIIE